MKKHITIGMYVGQILLERDLKYQKWLKASRPVSFSPKTEPVQEAIWLEKLLHLRKSLLSSKRSVALSHTLITGVEKRCLQ